MLCENWKRVRQQTSQLHNARRQPVTFGNPKVPGRFFDQFPLLEPLYSDDVYLLIGILHLPLRFGHRLRLHDCRRYFTFSVRRRVREFDLIRVQCGGLVYSGNRLRMRYGR